MVTGTTVTVDAGYGFTSTGRKPIRGASRGFPKAQVLPDIDRGAPGMGNRKVAHFRSGKKSTDDKFSDAVLMSRTTAQFVPTVTGHVEKTPRFTGLLCEKNLLCVSRYKPVEGFTCSTYAIYNKRGWP